MPAPWQWDDASKRYRDVATGRYIGIRQMLPLRDVFVESQKSRVDDLAGRFVRGEINRAEWVDQFKQVLRTTYKDEYALAIGGRNNMTQRDYGIIGSELRGQYQYLYKFADQIEAGQLTEAQIRIRSRMYVDSATQAFERGHTESLGVPKLPAYPGDGSTQCRSNCKCHWELAEQPTHWEATWKLGLAEHCPDCVQRSTDWAPLVSMGGQWQRG
jgi:hypothetical protein